MNPFGPFLFLLEVDILWAVSDDGPFSLLVSSSAGKIINIKHLDETIDSINSWYMERGLFGMVSVVILCVGLLHVMIQKVCHIRLKCSYVSNAKLPLNNSLFLAYSISGVRC